MSLIGQQILKQDINLVKSLLLLAGLVSQARSIFDKYQTRETSWGAWCELYEIDRSYSYRLMHVWERFGTLQELAVDKFSASAIRQLASYPNEQPMKMAVVLAQDGEFITYTAACQMIATDKQQRRDAILSGERLEIKPRKMIGDDEEVEVPALSEQFVESAATRACCLLAKAKLKIVECMGVLDDEGLRDYRGPWHNRVSSLANGILDSLTTVENRLGSE